MSEAKPRCDRGPLVPMEARAGLYNLREGCSTVLNMQSSFMLRNRSQSSMPLTWCARTSALSSVCREIAVRERSSSRLASTDDEITAREHEVSVPVRVGSQLVWTVHDTSPYVACSSSQVTLWEWSDGTKTARRRL
eukprot:6208933-Pleurochrysis_carterae.AAC.2